MTHSIRQPQVQRVQPTVPMMSIVWHLAEQD